jgi:hypothetical protein
MKVFVYYNLRKHVWSVKALEGPDKGRVIAHNRYVILRNAYGKVSQAGRERVLREKRKNVHAGIVGEMDFGTAVGIPQTLYKVTYNPYKYDSFVYAGSEEPWKDTADLAFFFPGRIVEVTG